MILKAILFSIMGMIVISSLSLVYLHGPRSIYFGGGWNLVYSFYPPFLRVLEKVGIHSGRQDFLIGRIDPQQITAIRTNLQAQGFENCILSWKDTDEILNVRKVDSSNYQYHLRVYDNGEVRAHYEYSSEGSPFGHIFNAQFIDQREYFQELLHDYLLPSYSKSL